MINNKISVFLFLKVFFVLSFSSIAQNQIHICSKKNTIQKNFIKNKSLTITEENQANKYDVTFYDLDISMSNQNRDISGTVAIHAKTIDILDSIVLELFPTMLISDIRLNGLSANYNRTNSVLKIPINAPNNFAFIIEVDYAGTPPTPNNNPFGGSAVTNAFVSEINDKVTWTVSCPFIAHEWFPCKQILRDKADSCAVKITVPSNCKAGSNGILENTVDIGNGYTRFEWKHKSPILYYLICATIAPYIEYTIYAYPQQMPNDSIMIQNFLYGTPNGLVDAKAKCDMLPGFLELYSNLYGLYPFYNEKYGQCLAPLWGGMEHQTMTTIGVLEKGIIAHELAHSWWGDHVGIASFSDVWLSEGFATYSEYLMLENLFPDECSSLLSGWHSSVMSVYGGSVWHTDTLNVDRIYNGRLSYNKGGAIIHTLRHIINNDALFFQGLREFQVDFHDTVAIGLDFKEKMENVTGIDLTNFFQEWYFGEGYPKYSTKWNTVANDLNIEISHTASMMGVTSKFTNPLEIKFSRLDLPDTIVRFAIDANTNQFLIQNIGTVTGVIAIDPNNWIINKVGSNINDPNFTVSVPEIPINQTLLIYPNPTEYVLHIQMNQPSNYIVKLKDLNGKLLQESSFKKIIELNTSSLLKGFYLIEIIDITNKQNQIRKFFVF